MICRVIPLACRFHHANVSACLSDPYWHPVNHMVGCNVTFWYRIITEKPSWNHMCSSLCSLYSNVTEVWRSGSQHTCITFPFTAVCSLTLLKLLSYNKYLSISRCSDWKQHCVKMQAAPLEKMKYDSGKLL